MSKELQVIDGIAITEENRFSTIVKNKSGRADLRAWQEWFRQRGIQSVIVNTKGHCALYRHGLVDVFTQKKKLE